MDDPAGLSSKQEQQKWMELENVPEFAEQIKDSTKVFLSERYNEWHICSKTPDSDGLAYTDERFSGKSLLVDNPKFHHLKPNTYEMVANLAEERYNSIGFIYPQSGEEGNQIVALWRKVPAENLDKDILLGGSMIGKNVWTNLWRPLSSFWKGSGIRRFKMDWAFVSR